MNSPAISVEGIGKLYQLAHQSDRHTSFREALTAMALAPVRRFRQLRGTDTSLEDFWALRDVNFTVQRGEVVGIVGRNGAGKSTLLKILSRIAEPTEGRAVMRGRIASLLEVGTGFHPELTGRENIYLNGSILGMKRREIATKFEAIVAFAEVEKFLDTPVKRYSSGMYVRLAFAVAAHLDPEILIVDEVLAVGDAEFQKRCLGKMKEISEGGGRTVLFVSHNMAAVRSLCSGGILLNRGRVAMVGTATEVVDAYMSAPAKSGAVHVPQRPPGARIWMTRTEILADGLSTAVIPMGSEIELAVNFAASTPTSNPFLGWVLSTASGDRIATSNNRYQPFQAASGALSEGAIRCVLGQVPLMPGRYSLSFWLGDAAADVHVDEEAMFFEVVERDLWGLGRLPPRVAPMWWPTQFSVE